MHRHDLATIALVLSLALAGCSAVLPSSGGPGASSPTATATPTASDTPAPTESPTPTASPTPTPEPTPTPTPEYEEPKPPNTPMEGKNHDDGKERLRTVEFVNAERTDDGAYTNFDLEMHADTRMEDVDPANHGDVEGEPYFLVYVDGELVERSDYVEFRNGTFVVDVHPGGLDQFESGTHDMEVLLMDRDSEYDDVYGVWRTEFAYENRDQ